MWTMWRGSCGKTRSDKEAAGRPVHVLNSPSFPVTFLFPQHSHQRVQLQSVHGHGLDFSWFHWQCFICLFRLVLVLVPEASTVSIIHVCWRLFPSWWCQCFQLQGPDWDSRIKPATGDCDPAGYRLQTDLGMDELWRWPESTCSMDDTSSPETDSLIWADLRLNPV